LQTMEAASLGLRRAFAGSSRLSRLSSSSSDSSSCLAFSLPRCAPHAFFLPASSGHHRAFATGAAARSAVNEVEIAMAGHKLDEGLAAKLTEVAIKLRQDNDRIAKELEQLHEVRANCVQDGEAILKSIVSSGDVSQEQRNFFVETLGEIEDACKKSSGLQSQHFQNAQGVGEIKRTKSRLRMKEEILAVTGPAEDALNRGDIEEIAEADVELMKLFERVREERELTTEAVHEAERDEKSSQAKLRPYELKLRVRRGKLTDEVFETRIALNKHLYQTHRKSHRVARLRDYEVLLVKEIGSVERLRERLRRRLELGKLLQGGDKAKIAEHMAELQREIVKMQKLANELLADERRIHNKFLLVRADLRAVTDRETLESSRLREHLIALIHENEWVFERLAVLGKTQAQNFRHLGELKAAM